MYHYFLRRHAVNKRVRPLRSRLHTQTRNRACVRATGPGVEDPLVGLLALVALVSFLLLWYALSTGALGPKDSFQVMSSTAPRGQATRVLWPPAPASSPSTAASLREKLLLEEERRAIPDVSVHPHTAGSPPQAEVAERHSTGAAPYGPPPAMTAEERDLTQRLFALINQDRAERSLYPFEWNALLAGGARLHAWNMYHCGFSHDCPDGRTPCQRIFGEGIVYSDCGENIAYAGPYPNAWAGVYKLQEGMLNEAPTGWHRIHLTSTTLHRIGIGVYVDPAGYIWFVEDMAS